MSLRRKLEQLAARRAADDVTVTPEQGARARAELARRAQCLAEQADAGDQQAAEQLQRLIDALEAAVARRTA